MGLETGSTISSFITSNPTSSDPVNQGDDHLRLIKSVLQAQFPGSGGLGYATAITTTEAELNALHGFTNVGFASGTRMPFAQAAAPTGWTQDASDNANNRMLRVVNTAGNGIGGSASPILNNTVPSHTHIFTGTGHTHTDSGHTHGTGLVVGVGFAGGGFSLFNTTQTFPGLLTNPSYANLSTVTAGGTNSANAGASDWSPRYIDMIICAKN